APPSCSQSSASPPQILDPSPTNTLYPASAFSVMQVQNLGFFAGLEAKKKISLTSPPPQVLCRPKKNLSDLPPPPNPFKAASERNVLEEFPLKINLPF
uniref:Uncharacterized protein n=1 Tax=Ficedula albicollis TaxID=59894 RepID=A0A803VDJ9_FICAL